MVSTETARRKLEEQLRSLRRRTAAVERDLRSPHPADSEEDALARENDEVLARLDEGGRAQLARIEAALRRLDQGTWGTCARCGEPIDPKRLEALPDAPTCMGCAA